MAKIQYDVDDFGERLDALGRRENIRRILEAGSAEAVKIEQERTVAAGHVITGELKEGISAGPVHEDLGSAWQYVYPSGYDKRGQSLTVIGYVINYGAKGQKTAKTGDKFLTGKKKQLEDAVHAAMEAEAERIKNEIMR